MGYIDNETCRTSAHSEVIPLDREIWSERWELRSTVHQSQETNVKALQLVE